MRICLSLLIVVFVTCSASGGDNWPDFRGPGADGHSDSTGLPLDWSETKNVKWKVPIHDLGYSTPVVWGDQIWLTTAKKNGSVIYAVCIDFDTGKVIHDITVLEEPDPQRVNSLNSYATPSAVVEEGRVYVHFGTYGTACVDTATGKVLWRNRELHCNHFQGPVSSPVIFEDLVIVHLEGVDVQFIAAIDKNTGKTLWRTDRPKEIYSNLKPIVYKAFHTPVLVEVGGTAQLVSNGSLAVMGYDPRTGKEIWRVVYGDDNTISRIVTGHGLLFVNCGGVSTRLWAVRTGGKGDVTDTHVAWKLTDDVPLESSPVLVGDLLYIVSDKGVATCLDAKTGRQIWQARLEGRYGASLIHADGRIYCFNKKGKTTVIKPGRTFEVLAESQLDGGFYASAAVAKRSFILRTKTHLYRIQKP